MKSNLTGIILALGVKFDIPHAYDIWIFLLKAPWFPLKMAVEKPALEIVQGLEEKVVAEINVDSTARLLNFEISTSLGSSFSKIELDAERRLLSVEIKERIVELSVGSLGTLENNYSCQPILRNIEVLLVTSTNMSLAQFGRILESLGAKVRKGFLGELSIENHFVLCDGPGIDYTLKLTAKRRLARDVNDQAKIFLSW